MESRTRHIKLEMNILDKHRDQSLLRPGHSNSLNILNTMLSASIRHLPTRRRAGIARHRTDFSARIFRMLVKRNIIILLRRHTTEDHTGPANQRANTHSCYTHIERDRENTSIKSGREDAWVAGDRFPCSTQAPKSDGGLKTNWKRTSHA